MDESTNFGGGVRLSYAELKAMAINEANCSLNQRKRKCGNNLAQCQRCPYGHGHLLYNSVDPYQRLQLDQMTSYNEYLHYHAKADDIASAICYGFFFLVVLAGCIWLVSLVI